MERNLMTFTKKKLAAAIGGTLLASVGVQQAQAVVDIDNTASVGISYASELVIGTSGISLSDATDLDVRALMAANGVQADTDVRVTLTLSSGTFTAPPAMTIVMSASENSACIAAGTALTTACATPTLFTGGTTADSSVTFNTATGTGTIRSDAHVLFAINGVTVLNQSAVTATVTSTIADNFGPTDLPTTSGALASFAPLLSVAAEVGSAEAVAIDVAQNSLFFADAATGDTNINVGGGRVVVSATARNNAETSALAIVDVLASTQHTVTAPGGFAAFNQGTAGGSVTLNNGAATAIALTVSTADTTLAVGPTAAAVVEAATFNDVVLTVPSANTVTIDTTTLTDTITTVTAAAAYSNASSSGTVALGGLTRNGSAARLTFSVSPTSPYPMSIRVTNDSVVVGPTTLTLTNDDGATSAPINITAITGGPTADLAAGASTGLLSIADVFTAVQAADTTFALGASSNKLRVDVTSLTPSIVLNAFSLSSDGTTFSMVTDAGA